MNYSDAMSVPWTGVNEGRIEYLESIASHFLGNVSLCVSNLQRIAEKLQDRQDLPHESREMTGNLAIGEESFTVKAISTNSARMYVSYTHRYVPCSYIMKTIPANFLTGTFPSESEDKLTSNQVNRIRMFGKSFRPTSRRI